MCSWYYGFKKYQSAGASCLFDSHPHLNTIHFSRQDFAEKKTSRAKRSREDFFPANPKGTGLGGKWIVQKFVLKKGRSKILSTYNALSSILNPHLLPQLRSKNTTKKMPQPEAGAKQQ